MTDLPSRAGLRPLRSLLCALALLSCSANPGNAAMDHLVCVIRNAPVAPADYGARLCDAVSKAMKARVANKTSGSEAAKTLPAADRVHELDVTVKPLGLSVVLRSGSASSWKSSSVKKSEPVSISVSDTTDYKPGIAALAQAVPFLLQSLK